MSPRGPAARLGTGVLLSVAGVVLAIIAAQTDNGVVQDRARACDPRLSMPASAWVWAWTALLLAAAGLVVVLAARPGPPVRVIAVTACGLVVLLCLLVVHIVISDAAPPAAVCGG